MRKPFFLLVSAVALAAVAAAWQVAAKLPPPFHTPSATNAPKVIERPDGAKLQLPAGFQIDEYATGFERPRTLLYGPSGEILLADAVKDGAVYVFQDKSGKAGERKKLIDKLDRPFGLAIWKDYLYVAETTSVKRYKYDSKAMKAGPGQEIVPMPDYGKGHWTRALLFDAKGEKFYLTIGSESNVNTGESADRAAIHQYNPDGTGHVVVATGTRNPTMIKWYPGTPTLWAAIQERDGLGDDLVPDYLTHIQPGGFYGWPYSYIGPNEDPRNTGKNPDLVKKTITPDVPLGAHVAVIDFLFYSGKQFPAEYRGGAFLAFHGSWNRSQRVGYSVAYIPFKNGNPVGGPKEFLKGWMLDPSRKEVWGRPVSLLEMKDGSLLVTDDGGNKIWRITYKG